MEESIAIHRHWQKLANRNKEEMAWPEAVIDWYDYIYLPLAEKIQATDILTFFPGRTEADLVVFVLRHWDKLTRDYGGENIPANEALADFVERTKANPLRRLLAWFERRILGKPIDREA